MRFFAIGLIAMIAHTGLCLSMQMQAKKEFNCSGGCPFLPKK